MPKLPNNLQAALALWAESGHTQSELANLSGIDKGTVSQFFSGNLSLTLSTRLKIFEAFRKVNLRQGLLILRADIEDSIPPPARRFFRIEIEDPAGDGTLREDPATASQAAKLMFIDDLLNDDPQAVALVQSLYEWASQERRERFFKKAAGARK